MIQKDLTILQIGVEYGGTAYKPYQEWWRERPDETRQPAFLRGAKSGGNER